MASLVPESLGRAHQGELTCHGLRHACASLLMAQGVNPRVVMEVLGHAQITLTLGTYSHVAPELSHAAVAKLDGVLGTA